MTFDEILSIPPYSLNAKEKGKLLTDRLMELTELHQKNCLAYKNMLTAIEFEEEKVESYKDLPFLPVRLFKDLDLKSIPDEEVVKTMTSSGTSGQ